MNEIFLDLPDILEGDEKGKNKIIIPNEKLIRENWNGGRHWKVGLCKFDIQLRMNLNKVNLQKLSNKIIIYNPNEKTDGIKL